MKSNTVSLLAATTILVGLLVPTRTSAVVILDMIDTEITPSGVSANGSVFYGVSNNGTVDRAFIRYNSGKTWTDLGALGDPATAATRSSSIVGISGDGSVICGFSGNGNTIHAFKYSGNTMTDLGALGDPATAATRSSYATGISADGSAIFGFSNNGTTDHAFKYSGNTMTDLGALGDPSTAATRYSYVNGSSADGSVICGYGYNGTAEHAFKYSGNTLTDLGALGDPATAATRSSSPNGISADGSVIYGVSNNGITDHAFKYSGNTMTDLGALGDPATAATRTSNPNGSSADGSVICGWSNNGTTDHGFKYSGNTMTDLGALGDPATADMRLSSPNGISTDGTVIYGLSDNGTAIHAFRYSGNTMTDLGALGDPATAAMRNSTPTGMSANGDIICGHSDNGTAIHAFKYSGNTMTDLGALGDPATAATRYSTATGISADGSVIYGQSFNGTSLHGFIYTGKMVDVDEWMRSISGPAGVLPIINSLASLPMEGAHHRPLMSLDSMGKKNQSWVTGDFGTRSRTSDSHTASGEAGFSSTFGDLLAGLAVGYGEQNNNLLFSGSNHISGQYLLGEIDVRLSDNKTILSLTGILGNWKSSTLRGYETGTGVDYSQGSTSLNSTSVRLRIDGAPQKFIGGPVITPFASFTWSRATADAFDETGGSFDAHFNGQSHISKEGRLGLSTNFKLGKATTLLTTLEWIHRFDKSESGFSGTDIDHGALPFDVAGASIHSNQARLGIDVDHKVNPTTMLNFSAHVTSVGEAPDIATAISLRHAF